MAACSTPLTSIVGTDCIGDSRIVINNNFTLLSQDLCSLYSTVTGLSSILNGRIVALSAFVKSLSAKDSPTIDLSFNANSYFLSADVIDNSLGIVKLGQDVTTFGKRLLTSTNIPLSSLAGVKLTSTPILGQILRWDGGFWTNETVGLTGLLTDGNKVDITVSGSGLSWNINPGVVDSTELANNAVIESKIYKGSVTTSKLASAAGFEAVVTETIRDNAVTTAKISAAAITESKIDTDAITTTKILNSNVTNTKLATMTSYSVKGNATGATNNPTDIQATTANTVLRYTGSGFGFGLVPNEATTGTTGLVGSTLVLRDSSGNFSAGVVTASAVAFGFVGNLQGNALYATDAGKLQTARTIALSGAVTGSASFDGSANITINTQLETIPNVLYVNSSTSSASWRSTPVLGGNDTTATGSTSAPFKTLKACLEYVYPGVNFKGNDVTIRLCPGMYQGTSIAGMPVGTSTIGTTKYNRILIQGDTGSASYISQFQLSTYNWRHMEIKTANIYFDNVTFRYDTSLPFVVTTGPGTGTNSLYAVVYASANSDITFANCVFEAVPLALNNDNPQEAYTRYILLDNYTSCNFENITINNFLNGTGATTTMGRYFWNGYRSRVRMTGTVTLQNGPRFSAFCEPSQGTYYDQAGNFTWAGNFGTRLGSGTNANFPTTGYRPTLPNNYLIKQDGPHSRSIVLNVVPGNALQTAYSAATEASNFNLIYFLNII